LAVQVSALAASSKEVPSWVEEASSKQVPTYPGDVPAVVLLDERHVTLEPSGVMTIESRKAIKVLTREGAKEAEALEPYSRNGRKVTRLNAWLTAPNGFTKSYDKNSVEDIGLFESMELYNDLRLRRVHAENAEIGSVFAYESEVQEPALFAQDEYVFQDMLPSLRSRYSITLPAGWSAKGVMLGHDPEEPVVNGSTYVWELKDLGFRRPEEYGPHWRGLTPRLAVNIVPGAGAQAMNSFQSWASVARWHAALSAGTDEVTPEIAAKVQVLTANAPTPFEKVRAISRYVQNLKYVAIEMNLERGEGYKPHTAATVFRHEYGDCKDKANLMHTMLKAAGIESYLVAIYAGDRTYVREEWPSPMQFNHMIVAIRLPEASRLPTILSTPESDRLLIFDPTSETTPMGDLPEPEQGSFALICDGARGALARMPATPADANVSDVSFAGTLSPDGDLKATLTDTMRGQFADSERSLQTRSTPDQYRNVVQERLYRSAKGVSVSHIDKDDAFIDNVLHVKIEFSSASFGQVMQQRLLVFTPSISIPLLPLFPTESQRHSPVLLHSAVRRKHVRITLPAGFTVDELPQPFEIKSEYGQFSVKYTQTSGELEMDEELKTEAATIPATDYMKVKKFFDQCNGADHQQTVLVKN
jgi:hypothetical protein